MNETQTQIDRLIELAIVQRTELKQLVQQLPQLREHLSSEIERTIEEIEPQLRAELEQFCEQRTVDENVRVGTELEAKIKELAVSLESTTAARYSVLMAERAENDCLLAQAEARISLAAATLPDTVKAIVSGELARFPRAGEIDQLRKEFAEPKSLNPRGKWEAGTTYYKLDLVGFNGDSYVANEETKKKPSRDSTVWTLSASRGNAGSGNTLSITELVGAPVNGQILIGSNGAYVPADITAGDGIAISTAAGFIQISSDGGTNYSGTWNANTNTPTLASSVGTKGHYYVVNVDGSTNLNGVTDWKVGDWAIYNGAIWQKVDNSEAVTSVFGRFGVITAGAGDYTATQITNAVAGNIVATTVQAAINELDTKKLAKASNLSDLASAVTARTNLGLGTLATQSGTFSGVSSGTNTGDQTSVSGNAATATALQTPRAINGVNFDGSAPITVAAAAGTLTGATLAANVTASSLTSVGTLTSLTANTITSAAATNLTLGTGTFGTALTLASATGALSTASTTASTSTTTGALTVGGGIGVAGAG